MPTYDYQCKKCDFEFERDQRITADPIKTCPKCKSRRAERLLSAPRFILKGGGWYADGYGSSGAKKSADDSASGDASASKSDSTGSDKSTDSSTGKTSKKTSADSASSSKKASGGKSGKHATG